MSNKLKESVLAKCGGIAPNDDVNEHTWHGYFIEFNEHYIDKANGKYLIQSAEEVDGYRQTLYFGESTASDSWVWAAAAQILEVEK